LQHQLEGRVEEIDSLKRKFEMERQTWRNEEILLSLKTHTQQEQNEKTLQDLRQEVCNLQHKIEESRSENDNLKKEMQTIFEMQRNDNNNNNNNDNNNNINDSRSHNLQLNNTSKTNIIDVKSDLISSSNSCNYNTSNAVGGSTTATAKQTIDKLVQVVMSPFRSKNPNSSTSASAASCCKSSTNNLGGTGMAIMMNGNSVSPLAAAGGTKLQQTSRTLLHPKELQHGLIAKNSIVLPKTKKGEVASSVHHQPEIRKTAVVDTDADADANNDVIIVDLNPVSTISSPYHISNNDIKDENLGNGISTSSSSVNRKTVATNTNSSQTITEAKNTKKEKDVSVATIVEEGRERGDDVANPRTLGRKSNKKKPNTNSVIATNKKGRKRTKVDANDDGEQTHQALASSDASGQPLTSAMDDVVQDKNEECKRSQPLPSKQQKDLHRSPAMKKRIMTRQKSRPKKLLADEELEEGEEVEDVDEEREVLSVGSNTMDVNEAGNTQTAKRTTRRLRKKTNRYS